MLDKRRIRLMTRMSMYEKKNIQKDLRISTYYKKDYASLNTWISILWITIGYAFVAGAVGLCFIDQILNNLTIQKLAIVCGIIFGLYIVLIVVYGVCASTYYKKIYSRAKHRMKRYYRDLTYLEKMMKKEKSK